MTDPLAALTEAGVSIWLDDLSRDRLTSGSLADLVARDHVAGVTTTARTSPGRSLTGRPTGRSCVTWQRGASGRAKVCGR